MNEDVPTRECEVLEAGPLRYLVSGDMIHGAQYVDGERREVPVPYFPSPGPVDDLFAVPDRVGGDGGPAAVGVIGLGTGGLAAHGRDGQSIVFFEHDRRVVEFARGDFSYLSCTPAAVRVVEGDGRRALGEYQGPRFGLLVVDAFVGDAVPSHLLTREAFRLYAEHLAPGGAIAVHTSNKFIDLGALVANVARAEGMRAWGCNFEPGDREDFEEIFVEETHWVAVASNPPEAVGSFEGSPRWSALESSEEHPVWTDADAEDVPVFR